MIRWFAMFATALVLTACVTINVYFPAAEAREAAREFVDDVIGREAAPASTTPPGGMARGGGFHPLMLLGISTAHAQSPDITIRTPAIEAIRSRMAERSAARCLRISIPARWASPAMAKSRCAMPAVFRCHSARRSTRRSPSRTAMRAPVSYTHLTLPTTPYV